MTASTGALGRIDAAPAGRQAGPTPTGGGVPGIGSLYFPVTGLFVRCVRASLGLYSSQPSVIVRTAVSPVLRLVASVKSFTAFVALAWLF